MSDASETDLPRERRGSAHWLDQLIERARAAGEFDGLAGTGRPIDTSDDLLVPPEQRLAFRMLRSHGFAPPWVEARRDIDTERRHLAAWLQRTRARWPALHPAQRNVARADYRRQIEELRRMILHYNLRVPPAVEQLPLPDIAAELARLDAADA
ncbi:MAG: DUF1992 domain-containing protein [Chloroflexi bacterium]|nr:DUF1992 domain-containing protein [Chloroflexota bacterium]